MATIDLIVDDFTGATDSLLRNRASWQILNGSSETTAHRDQAKVFFNRLQVSGSLFTLASSVGWGVADAGNNHGIAVKGTGSDGTIQLTLRNSAMGSSLTGVTVSMGQYGTLRIMTRNNGVIGINQEITHSRTWNAGATLRVEHADGFVKFWITNSGVEYAVGPASGIDVSALPAGTGVGITNLDNCGLDDARIYREVAVTNVTANPGAGSVAVSGRQTSIATSSSVQAGSAALTVQGRAVSVASNSLANVGNSALQITEHALAAQTDAVGALGAGSLAVQGHSALSSADTLSDALWGILTLLGLAPTVALTSDIAVEVGTTSLELTGHEADRQSSAVVTSGTSSISGLGHAPVVDATSVLVSATAQPGSSSITVTGHAVATYANATVNVAADTMAIRGSSVSAIAGAVAELLTGSRAFAGFAPDVMALVNPIRLIGDVPLRQRAVIPEGVSIAMFPEISSNAEITEQRSQADIPEHASGVNIPNTRNHVDIT